MSIPSPADGSATSKCIECGADISSKAKFCADCGALQVASRTGLSEHVEEDAAVDSPTTSNSAEERSPTEAATSENASHVCEHPSRKQLIAASLVVGCLAICSALYFGFRMSPKEQFDRGFKYETGQSVKQDDAQAASWYQKAADRGYASAQNNLGRMYENGRGGLAKDDTQAVFWYKKAAEQDCSAAQSNLGNMYATGHGVAKDETEAVRWFSKAADQGEASAQFGLGWMYEYGQGGLAKDNALSLSWYEKAAEQGYAQANAALANLRTQQARMEAQIDWVTANLNGHHSETSSDSDIGRETNTESVSAEVDSLCSLHIMEQSRIIASVPGKDDWVIDDEDDCRVSLVGFSSKDITISNNKTFWFVEFQDDSAVQCVASESSGSFHGTPKNTHTLSVTFSGREEAKQLMDGFERLIHDSCPAQGY